MTISVVIATYNRAPLLRECLEQLQRLTFLPGDEVIVVDNASTDDTAEVVRDAARRFPVPLRYLLETAPGKTPALIRGIAASTADLLALTDDDVVVGDDWIAALRQAFADPTLALVGGRVEPRWERQPPVWLNAPDGDTYGRMMSPLAVMHYGWAQDLGARTAMGANMAVRRTVLEAVGGFSPHLGRMRGTLMCGEDHEFCQRVRRAGYRCEYRPEVRVRHWVPAERITVRYYLRWFAWSGVTHALLEEGDPPSRPYMFKRLLLNGAGAMADLARGRRAAAAERVMDAAFCAGFLWQSLKVRRQEVRARRQQAPQLPASPQTPAISIPDRKAGNLY